MTTTEPLAAGLLQDLERLAGFKFGDEAKQIIEMGILAAARAAIDRAVMSADLAWQLTQDATAAASRAAAVAEPPKAESGEGDAGIPWTRNELANELDRLTVELNQREQEFFEQSAEVKRLNDRWAALKPVMAAWISSRIERSPEKAWRAALDYMNTIEDMDVAAEAAAEPDRPGRLPA